MLAIFNFKIVVQLIVFRNVDERKRFNAIESTLFRFHFVVFNRNGPFQNFRRKNALYPIRLT